MDSSSPHLLDQLAEDFARRMRAGENPSIEEYAQRHHELAENIRELFPTLMALEQLAESTDAEADPRQAGQDHLIGKRLGSYRLLRVIGRGGMGVVYEAEDESLGRHVAVKILPTSAFDPSYRERFRREATAAATLHHTNIVPVFEFGEADGVLYYAMQYIRGQGLDQVLRELSSVGRSAPERSSATAGALAHSLAHGFDQPPARELDATAVASATTPAAKNGSPDSWSPAPSDAARSSGSSRYWDNVARIGQQVADATAYAHSQGVLHRDIKPANLLLDTQGNVWVTDFGLAKTDDQRDLTRTGDVIGTLRYLAPEGLSGVSSAQSDICSLGLTLYELAALRPAYDQTDHRQLMKAVEQGVPPRLSRIQRRIPRDLETIIHKSAAHEPSDRYASAAEMAADLHRFLQDKPVRARRASTSEQLIRWCRRNPALAATAATAVGLLILACVSLALLAINQNRHAKQLVEEVQRANRAEEAAVASDNQSKLALAEAYHNQAQAIRFSDRAGRRFDSLVALRQAVEALRELPLSNDELQQRRLLLRNDAIASLGLYDVDRPQPLPPTSSVFAITGSFDKVACSDDSGATTIADLTGKPLQQLPRVGTFPVGRFSDDGQYFALHARIDEGRYRSIDGKYRLQLWHLPTQTIVRSADLMRGAPVFGPASGRLYWADGSSKIRTFDPATNDTTEIDIDQNVHYLRLPADEQLLAAWRHRGRAVYVCQASSGQLVHELDHPARVFEAAWAPNHRQLACAVGDFHVHVWDVAAGTRWKTLSGHNAEVISVHYSPDGALLGSSGWDQTSYLWDGQDFQQLLAMPGTITAFNQDGQQIVRRRRGVKRGLSQLAGGQQLFSLHAQAATGKGPKTVDVHPNGRLLVTASADGYRLWDLVHRQQLAHFRDGTDNNEWRRARFLGTDAVLTSNYGMAAVWPLKWGESPQKHRLNIGPPTRLPVQGAIRGCHAAANGRRLVIATAPNLYLFEASRLDHIAFDVIDGGREFIWPVLSPDGKWLVVQRMREPFRVWEVETGQLAHEFGDATSTALGAFSPDGRWLVTSNRESCRLWHVGSWQAELEFPRAATSGLAVSFSHDGRWLAYQFDHQTIRLMDLEQGREIARFQPTKPGVLAELCFSPENRHLIATTESHYIQVWDLDELHRELDRIGLAWSPPADDARPPAEKQKPIQVQIQQGPDAGQR